MFVLVAFPFFLIGQLSDIKRQKIDSLSFQLLSDSTNIYKFKPFRPYINYHERNSLSNPRTVNFFGPQIGILFRERHFMGIGTYFSSPNTRKPRNVWDGNREVTERLNMRYTSIFYQFVLLNYRFCELHLPFAAGLGDKRYSYSVPGQEPYKKGNEIFAIGEAGTQLILKPIPWLGISSVIGYRNSNEEVISGYFYAIGVWVGFRSIAQDVNYHIFKKPRYKRNVRRILKS